MLQYFNTFRQPTEEKITDQFQAMIDQIKTGRFSTVGASYAQRITPDIRANPRRWVEYFLWVSYNQVHKRGNYCECNVECSVLDGVIKIGYTLTNFKGNPNGLPIINLINEYDRVADEILSFLQPYL